MTTHEVEVIFGITKQTLIYYEKEGLVVCQRDANNYRNYSSKDLDTLKMVLLLRSMEISIDEIKLIMNSELSIRYVLERKQEYIEQLQIELKDIDEKIKAYIQRHKVEVIFDNSINHEYEGLLINQNEFCFNEVKINCNDIMQIDLSMCSSKGCDGKAYFFLNYYVDNIFIVFYFNQGMGIMTTFIIMAEYLIPYMLAEMIILYERKEEIKNDKYYA
mgnify:CR=1 FL=1